LEAKRSETTRTGGQRNERTGARFPWRRAGIEREASIGMPAVPDF